MLWPQIHRVDVFGGQPGQRGQLPDRRRPLRFCRPGAEGEHPRVLTAGVLLRLGEHLAQRPVTMLAVIVRDRRVGRQVADVGVVIAAGEHDRAAVEEGGDQDQPVQVEPGPLLAGTRADPAALVVP